MANRIATLLKEMASARLGAVPTAADRLVIGLVGRGILSSRSPAMHEREAARLGISCSYLLVDFDRLGLTDDALPNVIAAAAEVGFRGLNVTHPYKQAVIPRLDAVSDEVRIIGAVNTVVFGSGRATGHNTDSWGFAESFRDGMGGVALDRVALIGAGGAGAAVAHALLSLGAKELLIVDKDRDRAGMLAVRMKASFGGRVREETDPASALAGADGFVNATPVGMAKYPGVPVPAALIESRLWVADIVYFPAETELLRLARSRGCRTLAGAGMAIGQAQRAFELFTGHAADRAAMTAHFEAAA